MDFDEEMAPRENRINRREFVAATVIGVIPLAEQARPPVVSHAETTVSVKLEINGVTREVQVDSRVTLLDLLRENLHLTGTKKGCDHGQCGACTVLVNGRRINSCLSLAAMNDGCQITTVEGLALDGRLHPMQSSFVEYDGLQCGYCTPGQICSAVAMIEEARAGAPSSVTRNRTVGKPIELTDDEIRERMSGNICRCGAYVGIVAAIRAVDQGSKA